MKQRHLLEGHPKALFVLDYGLFKVRADGRQIGICGFLVRTDADENVLIDTGFPAKYVADISGASAEDNLGAFGEVLNLTKENLPQAQLDKMDVSPDDITLNILSHSHIDHVGGLHDFPAAPIVMARAERQLPKPLYWGGIHPLEWPDTTYNLIDDDTEIGPGFEIFLCPGHAPGQLAFRLNLPNIGAVILTSDAISRPAEIAERFSGSWDADLALRHAERLMQLAHDSDAFVIYGHCPDQWPTLRKAPMAYS